jgi:molecular chaperone HtpG
MSENTTVERHEFSAEVGRLLDLVVHSLYSDREIFLRELVANAADATDRRRFEALTNTALTPPADANVRIAPDAAAKTITIADSGVGMSKAELTQNLGTIARSGTRAFGQEAAKSDQADKPSLIGQFGVGFYSAFMVADRVEVTSKRAGSTEAWTWSSEGGGAFTLAAADREEPGTTIVLHIKDDAAEFLEPIRLETIIRKWADHITVPILVAQTGEAADKPANEGTALWRKPKSEITPEQYKEFYHHVAHAYDEPWSTLHWRAEGAIEFTALLFIPGMRPFEPVEGPRESRVRLHVRRMFITDEAALLPPWARFVQGVVDTEDLPLNVSREMLQATPVLARIRKSVTGRVMTELKSRAKEAEEYGKFWEAFGSVLKEGVWDDAEYRQELAPLMRFKSSAVEGLTGLADYISRMKPEQEAIYFLAGDDAEALAKSPQLEGFKARGVEVLLLTDQVDAFWPERLAAFDGKDLKSVTQGAADLAKLPGTEPEGEPANVEKLIEAMKSALGAEVGDVRATDRLVDSAVVLAAAGFGPDLQMQRILKRHGRQQFAMPATLEINPRHPLVKRLAERADAGDDIADPAHLLLDVARIQDGDLPADPAAFARKVTQALVG